jgi:hypothetical protein
MRRSVVSPFESIEYRPRGERRFAVASTSSRTEPRLGSGPARRTASSSSDIASDP